MPTSAVSTDSDQTDPVQDLLELAQFARLDPAQLTAATHPGRALRIVAGAGTGKTTTLSARAAWLVANGVPAERILVLTFTRRAAQQLVERTHSALSGAGLGTARVRGGTFHSVAHHLLRYHAASLGLAQGYSVIDPADARDAMGLARAEHLGAAPIERRFPRSAALLDMYSRSVNTQRPLSETVPEIAPWATEHLEDIAGICRAYVARKRRFAMFDYDDLLLHLRAALRDPHVAPLIVDEFDHICVDEYQDVNTLQVDIVTSLTATAGLTVVGDAAQSVYGFRGSDPEHLLSIADDVPGIATVELERNFRSTQPILDLANAVGQGADGFLSHLHNPDRVGSERPVLHRCRDESDQAVQVCHNILQHREHATLLRDQAVLVRAAHHSAALEVELTRRRIPFVKYGGLRFLESAHVKDLMCLFRLVDNLDDELAWFRVLQLFDGVGPATARRVTALMTAEPGPDDGRPTVGPGSDHRERAGERCRSRWPQAVALLPARCRMQADALVTALEARPGESAAAHAQRLLEALTPLVVAAYDNGEQRVCDLDTVVAAASDAERVSDIAAELVLDAPASTSDLAGPPLIDDDWLTISTVHSAKGLEWDVVHVLNVSDGNFPSDMATGSSKEIEEERRLFYVAVTRPARVLHLSYPLRYHHHPRARDDAHTYGQPSRFLSAAASTYDQLTSPAATAPAAAPGSAPVGRVTSSVDADLDTLWS